MYEPMVYRSPRLAFSLELWARKDKPGPVRWYDAVDRRVVVFEHGRYVAKDPEEEWALEHHPHYGVVFVNELVWLANPEEQKRMANLARSMSVAATAGVDPASPQRRVDLRVVQPDQLVGCPHCEAYVRRDLWKDHRDLLHTE